MEIKKDKVHKRSLWFEVRQFEYQGIRITRSFHGWEEMLSMLRNNFNVSSVEEPTSRIDTNPNREYATHIRKKEEKCVREPRGIGYVLSLHCKFKCRQNSLDDRIGKMMKVVEKSKLYFPNFVNDLYVQFWRP